jgi:hypothetical protein
VIAVAIAAGVIAWLLVGGGGGKKGVKAAQAQAVSAQSLAALPSVVHHPVYWGGPKAGFTYELTRTSDGRIFGITTGTTRVGKSCSASSRGRASMSITPDSASADLEEELTQAVHHLVPAVYEPQFARELRRPLGHVVDVREVGEHLVPGCREGPR